MEISNMKFCIIKIVAKSNSFFVETYCVGFHQKMLILFLKQHTFLLPRNLSRSLKATVQCLRNDEWLIWGGLLHQCRGIEKRPGAYLHEGVFYRNLGGSYFLHFGPWELECIELLKVLQRILGYTTSKKSNVLNSLVFPDKLPKYKTSLFEKSLRCTNSKISFQFFTNRNINTNVSFLSFNLEKIALCLWQVCF